MKYDLLVVGFGKAGKTLAVKYANLGKKVAVVEKDSAMYGGTCINIGCIPTKTLVVSAEKGQSYEQAKERRDAVVAKLNAKNFGMLNNNANIDVYTVEAKFVANKVVEITVDGKTETLEAEIVVINTGATSVVPKIKGLAEAKNVYNSTEIQKLQHAPEKLAVLGGGNIGLEFSGIYTKLGSKVTVFNFGEILQRDEPVVRELAKQYMQEDGIEFVTTATTKEVKNNGEKVVVVTDEGEFEFDALLYATGRKPNTENLGLENTDIVVNERGAVVVDDYCRTNVEGVFAVGDVNGGLQFTYVSLDDFRIVWNYLQGTGDYNRSKRSNIATSMFITPTLSRVGLTEKEAREQGYEVVVGELLVANMPRGAVNGDPRGVYKVVVDKNTKLILGATLFAKNSEEVINLIKMAIDNNIPYTYIQNQVFTHPTMAENLNDVFNLVK